MKRKSNIVSWVMLIITICFACFSIRSCSIDRELTKEKRDVTYNVTGYLYKSGGYKRSEHRYVFLHNDKYGDFTFDVSPETFYNATQGKKTMTFNDSFYTLLYRANNEETRNKLIQNKEDFGISNYNDNHILLDSVMIPIYFMYPIILSLIWLMFDIFNDFKRINYLTLIVWFIGLITMIIISII